MTVCPAQSLSASNNTVSALIFQDFIEVVIIATERVS